MKNAILLLALCLNITISQAQLNRQERKIIDQVAKQSADAVTLLKSSVRMNSGTMNFDGVREVGDLYRKEFDELGFETSWVDGAAFNRAGHLVARHIADNDGVKLLLIGHLDTVFEPDHPLQDYRQEGDSILYGPGVVDMKGGDVIIIYALKALKEAGLLDQMNLWVVMTGDEEKSGDPLERSKKALTDAADWADVAIGFENGDSNFQTAVISRRGSVGWTLTVNGNAAHSSQVFSEKVGAGAIYEASRILTGFYNALAEEPLLTFNPGMIMGGTAVDFDPSVDGGTVNGKNNVVAMKAIVSGDIRAVSPEQLEMAKKKMFGIVENNLPGTDATLSFADGYPPLPPSESNRALLSVYSQVSEDLGFGSVEAVDPLRAGAADVSFASGRVEAAMDGIGLSGGNDHTADEFAELSRLDDLIARAAVFLYRLQKKK